MNIRPTHLNIKGLAVEVYWMEDENAKIKHKMVFAGNVLKIVCRHKVLDLNHINVQVLELLEKQKKY